MNIADPFLIGNVPTIIPFPVGMHRLLDQAIADQHLLPRGVVRDRFKNIFIFDLMKRSVRMRGKIQQL